MLSAHQQLVLNQRSIMQVRLHTLQHPLPTLKCCVLLYGPRISVCCCAAMGECCCCPSTQLGWGLWLFPAAYARLGWLPGIGITLLMALTSVYSGTLLTRLYMAVPEAGALLLVCTRQPLSCKACRTAARAAAPAAHVGPSHLNPWRISRLLSAIAAVMLSHLTRVSAVQALAHLFAVDVV
jgi:hypothetical protein